MTTKPNAGSEKRGVQSLFSNSLVAGVAIFALFGAVACGGDDDDSAAAGSNSGGSSGSSQGGSGGDATGGSATGGSANGGSANGGTSNGGSSNGGSSAGGSANGGSSSGGSAGAGAQGGSGGTSTGGTGGSTAGSAGSGASGAAGGGGSTAGAGGSSSGDPFAQYRQECIDKINSLRATKGLSPYNRWMDAEMCVDQQASHDQMTNIPHDAFSNGLFPTCNGNAQNECPGWGAESISACLDSMWSEGDQPGCSGCDACSTWDIFQGNCPNCTFNGNVVCGHYVNMTSDVFTEAACGFSEVGGWAAINFQ